MSQDWYVYVLYSESTHRTYVGVTIDIDRRLVEHNGEKPRGAKSTRYGRPWKIISKHGPYADRSEAQRMEARIKKLRGRRRFGINPLQG